jgi:hypothetical protein
VNSGLFHSHKVYKWQQQLKSSYWTKSSKMVDRCYRPQKGETCLLHLCSTSFLCSFGAGKYFLVRKLYQDRRAYVRTQKWHNSRYVRLKARSANLLLILDILIVWLGDAFYRTGGSSWIFWM